MKNQSINKNNPIERESDYTDITNEIKDRNNRLDYKLNNLAYYRELQLTQNLISKFTDDLTMQMVILASGGHRIILETFVEDELIDYLHDEIPKQKNPILNDLREIYQQSMLVFTRFASIVEKNGVFKEKEIENIVKEVF